MSTNPLSVERVMGPPSFVEMLHTDTGSSVHVVGHDIATLKGALVEGMTGETEWVDVARIFAEFCGLEMPVADENGDY